MTDHTHLPDDRCPACLHKLSCATAALVEGAKPGPGDLTLCLYCGAYLAFTEQMRHRLAAPTELEELDGFTRREFERARRHILARKPDPKAWEQ
jgi:hypothetical protein